MWADITSGDVITLAALTVFALALAHLLWVHKIWRRPSRDAMIVRHARTYANWISRALRSSGYRVDFSVASLLEIDRFFDEQAAGGAPRPGGLLSQDMGPRMFALGAYVGEVLRRKAGGAWLGDDRDPRAEIAISLRLGNGTIIWPMQRVMKRLKNGREDGIAAYGAALLRG